MRPCLKCLERDNVVFVAKCSTAATVAISSTVDVVSNPSSDTSRNQGLGHRTVFTLVPVH